MRNASKRSPQGPTSTARQRQPFTAPRCSSCWPEAMLTLARGYADKYRAPGVSMTLIGITFSKQARNLVGWESLQLA